MKTTSRTIITITIAITNHHHYHLDHNQIEKIKFETTRRP